MATQAWAMPPVVRSPPPRDYSFVFWYWTESVVPGLRP